MKKMERKGDGCARGMNYQTPQMRALEIVAENGFAGSDGVAAGTLNEGETYVLE